MAVKVISKDHSIGERQKLAIKREVEALLKITHPHIINFLGFHESDGNIEIFMGLKDGNLRSLDRVKLSNPLIHERVFSQILGALDCLNYHSIIHRDIKPENILYTALLDGSYDFQLGDFGLCNATPYAITIAGTMLYMAPELHRGRGQSTKADVWSLFVTMLWMLNAGGFRAATDQCQSYEQVVALILEIANKDPNAMKIREMAIEDPSKRASAADMLRKYFNGKGLYASRSNTPALFSPRRSAPEEGEPIFGIGLAGRPRIFKAGGPRLHLPEAAEPESFNPKVHQGVARRPDGFFAEGLRLHPTKAAKSGGFKLGATGRPGVLHAEGRRPGPPVQAAPLCKARPQGTPRGAAAALPRVTKPLRPKEPRPKARAALSALMPGGFPEE